MRYGIIFVLAMLLCGEARAEFRITKDRTPGGLYIVGPDISPDSLEGIFIYYSPDAGTTLIVKDTPDSPFWAPSGIVADYSTGNIYKIYRENMWHSADSCETWIGRISYSYVGELLLSGFEPGEVYANNRGNLVRSIDFGAIYDSISVGSDYNAGCLGWNSGEIFVMLRSNGSIYHSTDTLTSKSLIHNFGYNCICIRKGCLVGGLYVLSNDSIFYSADYGSTFVGRNTFPLDTSSIEGPPVFYDIVGGNFPGQIFGYSFDNYDDYFEDIGGGWIQICLSQDFGATFTCLTHTAEGITYDTLTGIEESPPATPEDFTLSAYPNPFNSAVTISLDVPVGAGLRPARVEIFDLAGRRVAQLPSPSVPLPEGEGGNSFSLWEKVSEGRMRAEFTWQPDATVGSGVYLVRARFDPSTGSGHRRLTDRGTESVTRRIVYLK